MPASDVIKKTATQGYGWAMAAGGGAAITQATTGFNPMTDVIPDPFTGLMYGSVAFNPLEAGRRIKYGITGKGSWRHEGAWGYKSLFTGVRHGSMLSQLSLGNVVLSGIEGIGKGIGHIAGVESNATIKAMSSARKHGLAGVFGGAKTPGLSDLSQKDRAAFSKKALNI